MEDWMEVSIDTKPEGIETVSNLLTALDFTGFVIEDESDFLTFLEENRSTWDYVDEGLMAEKKGVSRVKLYLPRDEEGQMQFQTLCAALYQLKGDVSEEGCGTLEVTVRQVKNEDWENNWKAYYKPFPVGEHLYIVPEWERELPVPSGRTPLYLNPGLIFGTGSHASTRLCMETMEHWLRSGDRVLDLGSGSGILSVLALKLGASFAAACDIDPKAEHVARENALRNGVEPHRYQVETGNVLEDPALMERLKSGPYQLVLSNIVADVIIALAPQISDFLAPGGVWISSGIIDDRMEDVEKTFGENGYEIKACREQEGWACYAVCRAGECASKNEDSFEKPAGNPEQREPAKQSSFFAYLSRMRYINRWGLMRNAFAENVQEHSHMVALFAHGLAEIRNRRFGGTVDPGAVALAALYHDAPEILTGDLPTPVKYANPDIYDAYHAVEQKAGETLLSLLPDFLREAYTPLLQPRDETVLALLKAADKLSAYVKCLEELKSGNLEFQQAAEQIRSNLEQQAEALPELAYFMACCLPAFGLSLDQLK